MSSDRQPSLPSSSSPVNTSSQGKAKDDQRSKEKVVVKVVGKPSSSEPSASTSPPITIAHAACVSPPPPPPSTSLCTCQSQQACTCHEDCRGFACRGHTPHRTRTLSYTPSPSTYRDWKEADDEFSFDHVRRASISHSKVCACRGSGVGCECLFICRCGHGF